MKTSPIAVALFGVLGLAACQPGHEGLPETSDAVSDNSSMVTTDQNSDAIASGANTPSTGALPAAHRTRKTINPDGTMNSGEPPAASPATMDATSPA